MAEGADRFGKMLAQASAVLKQAVDNQTKAPDNNPSTVILDYPKKAAADTLAGPQIRKEGSVSSILKREYRPVGELGEGGMGQVSSVVELLLDREVAMKRIRRPKGSKVPLNEEAITNFLKEPLVMAKVGHPNVPDVFEVNVDAEGNPYFTMTRIRGEDLSDIISKIEGNFSGYASKFPVSRRLEIFKDICYAIACAHSKGIIHRDLKPANAMVGGEFGEVYVIDWGLAKIIGNKVEFDTGIMHTLGVDTTQKTLDGIIKGTPSYMPPEQAEGRVRDIDERTDIYSLGAILYTFLSLVPPISGRNVDEVLRNVSRGYIRPLNQVAPGIDSRLSKVVMKALSARKEDRYSSVKEFIEDIDSYIAGVQKSVGDILGRALDALNRGHKYETIIKIIEEAKHKDPESEEAFMAEAQVNESFGKFEEAIVSYLAASDIREKKTKEPHLQALFYAAEIARGHVKDEKRYMGLHTRCALAGKGEDKLYSKLSEAYLLLGNNELNRAVEILTKLADETPSIPEPYELLGAIFGAVFIHQNVRGFSALTAQGRKDMVDMELGIFYLTRAIDNSSGRKQGDYYGMRALALADKGEFKNANEDISVALKLNNSVGTQLIKLMILAKQEKYEDALFLANYMIQVMKETENPILYFNRGVGNNFVGNLDDAIADYEKAKALNEKNPDPNLSLADFFYSFGVVYAKKGERRKAIEYYEKALKENPRDGGSLNNIADNYHELGDFETAVKYATKAVDLNGKDWMAAYTRALAYIALWKTRKDARAFKEGFEDLKRCLSLDVPKGPKTAISDSLAEAYSTIADYHLSKGRKEMALSQYREALKLDLSEEIRNKIDLDMMLLEKRINPGV